MGDRPDHFSSHSVSSFWTQQSSDQNNIDKIQLSHYTQMFQLKLLVHNLQAYRFLPQQAKVYTDTNKKPIKLSHATLSIKRFHLYFDR